MFKRVLSTRLSSYSIMISSASLAFLALSDAESLDKNITGLIRTSRTLVTCSEIVWDYHKTLKKDKETDYLDLKSACHQRSADRMLKLCRENRGVFIKLGQHISSLVYLIPREYIDTLRVLQDQCPATPLQEIDALFISDTGKSLKDTFAFFDPIPIGVASLAQVHKAILPNGTQVAVKIQHPSLDSYTRIDIKTVASLVKMIKKLIPSFQFDWLAEEMQKNLPKEMDFEHEAKNMKQVQLNFETSNLVLIPNVFYSHRRILVMEFVNGQRLDNLVYLKQHGISPWKVSSRLTRIYSEMIFNHGFVHVDPHPGNIFIQSKASFWSRIPFLSSLVSNFDIVLLDHGLYRSLDPDFRFDYAHLWDSLIRSDEQGIETYSYKLFLHDKRYKVSQDGIDHHRLFASMITGRSWEVIASGSSMSGQGLASQRDAIEMNTIHTKVGQARFLLAVSDILAKLPGELLLLLKTNDLLRGLDESLVGKCKSNHLLRMVSCMGSYCNQAIWKESIDNMILRNSSSWLILTRKEYWNQFFKYFSFSFRLFLLDTRIQFTSLKDWLMRSEM